MLMNHPDSQHGCSDSAAHVWNIPLLATGNKVLTPSHTFFHRMAQPRTLPHSAQINSSYVNIQYKV